MGGLGLAKLSCAPDARGQLLRFLVVGTGNTALSYAIYASGIAIGLTFQIASVMGLAIGIVVSFVTQGRLVFLSRLEGRFVPFAIIWAGLYFANITLIRALHWGGLDYYLAGLAAAVPVTVLSFVLQRQITFSEPRRPVLQSILIGLVLLLAFARLDLALRFEANWDEFLNLSMVHGYTGGQLHEVLQTVFVHLFTWVQNVAVNEVDQIVAARLLVLTFVALTSLAIYGIARHFMDVVAALVAVFVFNSFTFVMRNGGALRTDPLAVCASMVAIWLALARDFGLRQAFALGAMIGVAGALTIKAALYVPVIGAILLLRVWYARDRKRTFGLILLSGVTALASFLAIIGLHAITFPDHASPFAFVARTSGATLLGGDYSIFLVYFTASLSGNLAFWVLLGAGVVGAAALTRSPIRRHDGLILLCLGLMLLTPLIYRDTYPYYYGFMIAPGAVLAGLGYALVSDIRNGLYARLALAFLATSAVSTYVVSLRQDNAWQYRTLAIIHRLFPQPVPYIDHTSMVSSFPKQGIFMSGWGMSDYRHTGKAIMPAIIEGRQPRFVLVTRDLLDIDQIDPRASEAQPYGLLAEDVLALKANYLHYWGPLYLPGLLIAGDGNRRVRIAGRYRVNAAVTIDGQGLEPGATVYLAAQQHRFHAPQPVTLRWDAPPPPAGKPPAQLFNGF
jgi:putative flippase GtrA